MSESDIFDLIVVGGGPAGLSAAYVAASAGLDVAVLERGTYCGAKNMFGGIFFTNVMKEIMPDFPADAPLERSVSRRRWSLLTPDGEISLGIKFGRFSSEPHNNGYTVLRSHFDSWFAGKVEKAGASVITGATVDDVIRKDGEIVGVRTRLDGGDVYGNLIIMADGVNSLLAKKIGIHPEIRPENAVLCVKEILELPEEKIIDRFQLNGSEGIAYEYFGDAANGAIGSGFIYTNRNSISVGIGANVNSLISYKYNPNDLLNRFKNHPAIAPLVRGAVQCEYSAHLVPEGGYDKIPELYGDHVLIAGDAAGLVNNSLYHEGTNLAMASGKFAAEVAIEAKKRNNFTKSFLSAYKEKLGNSFVFKDLKKFRKLPVMFEKNKKLFDTYPSYAEEFLLDLFTVDGEPLKSKQARIIKRLLKQESLFQLLKTGFSMRRLVI